MTNIQSYAQSYADRLESVAAYLANNLIACPTMTGPEASLVACNRPTIIAQVGMSFPNAPRDIATPTPCPDCPAFTPVPNNPAYDNYRKLFLYSNARFARDFFPRLATQPHIVGWTYWNATDEPQYLDPVSHFDWGSLHNGVEPVVTWHWEAFQSSVYKAMDLTPLGRVFFMQASNVSSPVPGSYNYWSHRDAMLDPNCPSTDARCYEWWSYSPNGTFETRSQPTWWP